MRENRIVDVKLQGGPFDGEIAKNDPYDLNSGIIRENEDCFAFYSHNGKFERIVEKKLKKHKDRINYFKNKNN